MKISILGGTGNFGQGIACRWCQNHEIFIGSRDEKKAIQVAEQINAEMKAFSRQRPVLGMANRDALTHSAVVVLSLRFNHLMPLLNEWKDLFNSKIVISPVVPLVRKDFFKYASPPEGSAALAIRHLLPDSCKVIATLHTIPAAELKDIRKKIEGDIIICGPAGEAKDLVKNLVEEIKDLRALDGGPLEVSAMVEPIVPLILNLKQFGLKRDLAIKFI